MPNVTIGQFYPVNSIIHSLDARLKLLAVFVYITALFTLSSFAGYALTLLCLSMVIYASNVPLIYMFKGLKMIIFIVIFTVILNIFFTPGENVIFSFWKIKVTLEGLVMAFTMALRLTLLIVGTSILTLTTSPIQLTDAIEYCLSPFRVIGVPSHEIAMMMTIALRFIPTLLEEMDKIMKAQMARGADFDTGGIIQKAKSLIPLLVPLFISSFRRADELGTAMEARCYRGGEGRTKMKEMRWKRRDYTAFIFLIIFIIAIIFINIFI